MTNNYSIVDGPNGEPTVANYNIRIRGYYWDKIIEIIEEDGWEAGAEKVCSYCGGYIDEEGEDIEDISRLCGCDEPRPSEPEAAI